MTDTAALYRTVVRLAGMDDTTVTLVIPATDFDQITFHKDNVHIPRWLLDKEIGYRFFAEVPIYAERPEQVSLWNCEHDPRTPAEQIDRVNKVLGVETSAAGAQDATCTIVTEFLGIMLDPCGKTATHTSTGRCERGHTRTRLICNGHADGFKALPNTIVCAQCASEGHDTPTHVTISEGVQQ